MYIQKYLFKILLLLSFIVPTLATAQSWQLDRQYSTYGRYFLDFDNEHRLVRDAETKRWSFTFWAKGRQEISAPRIVFHHSDGDKQTFTTDKKYVSNTFSNETGNSEISFQFSQKMLDAFEIAKYIRFHDGHSDFHWEFSLSGARSAMNDVKAMINDEELAIARAEDVEQKIRDCDLQTGNEWDGFSTVKGVAWNVINGPLAVEKCKIAYAANPGHKRIIYQLGRAYDKAGNPRAFDYILLAAHQKHYPAALHHLGYFYEHGQFTEKNLVKAKSSYRAAGEIGFMPSVFAYGRLRYEGAKSAEEKRIGLEEMQYAADKGLQSAINFLAKLP